MAARGARGAKIRGPLFRPALLRLVFRPTRRVASTMVRNYTRVKPAGEKLDFFSIVWVGQLRGFTRRTGARRKRVAGEA